MEDSEEIAPVVPLMYRWISTSRPSAAVEGAHQLPPTPTMTLSLCVPVAALPKAEIPGEMGEKTAIVPPPRPRCDVEGCEAQRKYRLVKDWEKGACGMPHLKLLETQFSSMTD